MCFHGNHLTSSSPKPGTRRLRYQVPIDARSKKFLACLQARSNCDKMPCIILVLSLWQVAHRHSGCRRSVPSPSLSSCARRLTSSSTRARSRPSAVESVPRRAVLLYPETQKSRTQSERRPWRTTFAANTAALHDPAPIVQLFGRLLVQFLAHRFDKTSLCFLP